MQKLPRPRPATIITIGNIISTTGIIAILFMLATIIIEVSK